MSIPDLTATLTHIFARYGPILDVVARKTNALRGQAFVVFERSEHAAQAMAELQGFPLMTKPMKIAYARTESDATKKQGGRFVEAEAEARRGKRRAAWADKVRKEEAARAQAEADRLERKEKKGLGRGEKAKAKCVILVENLPKEANEAMLMLVFQRFPGPQAVTMDKGGQGGSARVEYDGEEGADAAVSGLQGFKLSTNKAMRLKRVD